MKNIYTIIILALVGFSLYSGISVIGSYTASKGGLDQESINTMALYDNGLAELNASINSSALDSDFQPNNNEITDFFKEYYEHKTRVDQLLDTINLIYKLPDIMMNSVPFIDIDDMAPYRNTFWILLVATVFIAIILALRQGQMAADNT